ncbi:MAG: triose-phosphate isomerase [Flavobacteriales bacterium]|nr:triose-phosphate isomerase [Flavobacteriales bacterium]
MRKKIVAGNWKMNKSKTEAVALAQDLLSADFDKTVDLLIIPPFLYASELAEACADSRVQVGVQNCSEHTSGAYTGEVSVSMIRSVGVSHVLVGHSERREYFGEQNAVLAQKVDQVLAAGLTPIYCCGEQLSEREKNNHFSLVKSQLEEGLFHLSAEAIQQCVIAYEPVWAIGTGVTATADQAQEMHAFIRQLLTDQYGESVAQAIPVLYGGSCKPDNAQELFANSDVDGGLIGGASLVASDFVAIANSF